MPVLYREETQCLKVNIDSVKLVCVACLQWQLFSHKHLFMYCIYQAMLWLRWMVTGLSPWRPRVSPIPVCVGFMVDRVALVQVLYKCFSSCCHCHSTNATYSFICHCRYIFCTVYRWNYVTYRVIHKSLRDFQTRLRNNQDRHGRKEHINRQRISPSFFFCTRGLGVLPGSTARGWS